MKRNQIPLYTFWGLLSFLFVSCVDVPNPNEVYPPSWDLPLNFPITDSTITLTDMIDGDSSIVASDNPQSLGLLYFQKENIIDPIFVDTSLTLSGFSLFESQVIGSIKIYDVDSITQNILVTEWAPAIVPGDSMIFPESESDIEIPFPKMDSFEYAVLEEGTLKVIITNNLPIPLKLKGIKIKNAVSKETIASRTTPINIIAGGVDSVFFDLAGKTIEDSLFYEGTIYSKGSSGTKVEIPTNAGTNIFGTFNNIVVSEIRAPLPEQDPFIKDDIYTFDDSIKVDEAIFKDGAFTLTFNNYLDVDANINITIFNLKKSDGSTYSEDILLARNEVNKTISYNNLSDWKLVSLTPGVPTNDISYSATVTSIVSTEPSTISKNDSVSFTANFKDIALKHISGIITPVKFDIPETNFDFDLGEIQENFKFDKLIWGNPGIILTLNSSAKMQFGINGLLSGSSSSASNSMDFEVELPGEKTTIFDLRDYGFVSFINKFTTEIPSRFSFTGSAIVNPNYISGIIEDTDSVSGKINIEIPLDIGIAGGTFTDTLKIDSLDIANEDIDAVNSITLTIEVTNAIPIGLKMSGSVLDEVGNVLFPFPPHYNSSSEIIFSPPTVDDNGYVNKPAKSVQIIELRKDEARTFINNPNLLINLELNTSKDSSVKPVKFRNTDYIYYKIYGKINYRVNN